MRREGALPGGVVYLIAAVITVKSTAGKIASGSLYGVEIGNDFFPHNMDLPPKNYFIPPGGQNVP